MLPLIASQSRWWRCCRSSPEEDEKTRQFGTGGRRGAPSNSKRVARLPAISLAARGPGAFHTARPPGLGSPLLSVLASRRPPTDPPPKHPAPGRRQRTENDLNRKGKKIIPHDDVITSTCLTAYNPPSRSRSRVATRSDGVASRPQASCLRRGFLASQSPEAFRFAFLSPKSSVRDRDCSTRQCRPGRDARPRLGL